MPARELSSDKPFNTSYTSDVVTVPFDFLVVHKTHPKPNLHRVDFSTTDLKRYTPCLAIILENVLTPEECSALLAYAEASAKSSGGWAPALINRGPGREILCTDVRNNDRIIWDEADIVNRIWQRCLRTDGLEEMVDGFGAEKTGISESVLGKSPIMRGEEWKLTRLNERMRFLRYGPGMFFKPHSDSSYENPHAPPERPERSLLTLQLYLNSAKDEQMESVIGGATSFLSWDDYPKQLRYDVAPQTGRVLIFQQRNLYHEGQEVEKGLKYTMRTDVMYERVVEGTV